MLQAWIRHLMIGVTVAALSRGSAGAAEPEVGLFSPITTLSPQEGLSLLNHTFGGRQFWGDVQFFHDWHIQRNVFTGHYRLLDGQDRRHASGSLEVCREKLAEIRKEKKLPPMSGTAVVLLHGIFRSADSLKWMGGEIIGDDGLAISMDYPSTQISIPQAAEYLDSVLSNLEGIDEIHLVTHSMGGLVVRAYLAEHRDPRLRRLVMIAPPNRGAEMADLLRRNLLFRGLFGPSGQQLSTQGLIPTLPTPDFEFAIIAGARGTDKGWNFLIPGDDDGTVTVASTKLVGAADFATVPMIHTFLVGEPTVAEMARRFIREGRLKPEGDPQPIVADAVEPSNDKRPLTKK